MKPVDASLKENEQEVWDNVYNARPGNVVGEMKRSVQKGVQKSEQKGEQKGVQKSVVPRKSVSKFQVGDSVRISRIKGLFEKGYLPDWSEALYKIHRVQLSDPVTYILKDTNDEIISGSFYNEELQKSEQEMFRIEKIIKKKKIAGVEHGLVKWMGYSNSFNE